MLHYTSKNNQEPTVVLDLGDNADIIALIGNGMDPKEFLLYINLSIVKTYVNNSGSTNFLRLTKDQLENIIEVYKCMQLNLAREKENE